MLDSDSRSAERMWGKGVSVMSVSATGSYGSDGSSSLEAAGVLVSSPGAAGVPSSPALMSPEAAGVPSSPALMSPEAAAVPSSPALVSSPEAVAQQSCASEQLHQAERSGSMQSPAQSQYLRGITGKQ